MAGKKSYPKMSTMASLLSDWYGDDYAQTEMTAYCPDSVKLSDVAEKIMKKTMSKEMFTAMHLANNWESIVGAQLNKFTKFHAFTDRIVTVEVSHPMWLRELQGPIKQTLIAKINLLLKSNQCSDIKFIPGGR